MAITSPVNDSTQSSRLASLDILRGLDLFLLVFLQPVVLAFAPTLDSPAINAITHQLDHEVWEGFRLWDLVMPLFLFMTGVAIPFSLRKYVTNGNKTPAYRRILRRFIILFILGMFVQGNLLSLDPDRIYLYTNTLQAIAAGYLVASIVMLNCRSQRWLIAIIASLLIIYWIPMTFCGDFTPHGNFADTVDRALLGRFRDGSFRNSDGLWQFDPNYTYTWIWSSLTFSVTVILGALAGNIMMNGNSNRPKTAIRLLIIGVSLTVAGWLWSFQMPIIKRLWTSSMTLLAGGYSFILMAIFYYIIDCRGFNRGLNWLKIYGMNSITAYILGECINFRSIVNSLTYGLQPYLPDLYPAILSLGNYTIVFLILLLLHRHRLYLKI